MKPQERRETLEHILSELGYLGILNYLVEELRKDRRIILSEAVERVCLDFEAEIRRLGGSL